ncbi:MAG: site-2 protease family protein [Dehalococcoidia bacterium]|nr:site-2 protease family protein [Dehalococcoidia bacterium]
MLLITIGSFLLIFTAIILAHELGHFTAAKCAGVRVEEFGIGFPPRIFGIKRGETTYSLNWLPLGGFVKMSGEEDPQAPRSLASKSRLTRIMVLGAGAMVNALLPFILFSMAFMIPHTVYSGQVIIAEVATSSPAEQAGIAPGDIVISVNGNTINNSADLSRYISLNLGKETTFGLLNGDTQKEVTLTPRWKPPEGQGAIGVAISMENIEEERRNEDFFRSIAMGTKAMGQTMVLFKNSILSMFIGTSGLQITGPVGIAQITGEVARAGISPLLEFAGFISLSVAIMNLLPLPALDGGRIVFVLLEWIRGGRRVSPQTEGMVHFIGFIMLIGLAIVITYNDIVRIASGG